VKIRVLYLQLNKFISNNNNIGVGQALLRYFLIVGILFLVNVSLSQGSDQGPVELVSDENLKPEENSKESAEEVDNQDDLPAMNEDEFYMQELMSILEEETEIATKTKMNSDYVPGIVTVLHGDEMEALGARTVWEALGFVPGIETTINNMGRPLVIARGIGEGTLISGHIKIMLNSVPVNLTFSGTNDSLMLIPIEQVERIEIIRGPGSALYGEFSYAGVINIITRKDGKRIYGSAAQYDTYGGGGHFSYENKDHDFKASVNISGWDTDGADVNSGPDSNITFSNQPEISFSPGKTNEDQEIKSMALSLDYKKFNLDFYGIKRDFGQYFGIPSLQPSNDDKAFHTTYYYIDAKQEVNFSSSLKADFNFYLSENERKLQHHMIRPPGVILGPPPGPPPLPDGLWIGNFTNERRIEGSADFTWSGWEKHTPLLRLSIAEIDLLDAWGESNNNTVTRQVLPSIQRLPENQDGWIDPGHTRVIISAVLQDQFQVTDSISITGGVRFDDFDDIDEQSITPRIAGLWRIGEPHIIKAQYSRAFRPPTFSDLYTPQGGLGLVGNPDLEPETMETYEVGYIYRKSGSVGRTTIFYSKLKDMIENFNEDGVRGIRNIGKIRLQGVELEWEQKLWSNWKAVANLSYVDAKDVTDDHKVGGSADWLGNFILTGKIKKDLVIATRYLYVGDRNRDSSDNRDKLDGYNILNATLSHFNLGMKGFTARVGVQNLFDDDVRAPSLPRTYVDDLPRPGRTWWAHISFEF